MDHLDGRLIDCSPRSRGSACSRRPAGSASPAAPCRPGSTSWSASGVITGWGPELSPEALGFPVTAFLTLEIRQGDRATTPSAAHLADDPRGARGAHDHRRRRHVGRVVARSNTDLQRVIDRVVGDPGIVRSSTVIALAQQVPYRVLPLATGGGEVSRAGRARTPRPGARLRSAGQDWSALEASCSTRTSSTRNSQGTRPAAGTSIVDFVRTRPAALERPVLSTTSRATRRRRRPPS